MEVPSDGDGKEKEMEKEDEDVALEDVAADCRDTVDAKEVVERKSGAFGRQDVVDGPDDAAGGVE